MSSEITINSNIASLQTQRRLGQSTSALRQVFERLSSGQRINRASDDAAGLAISDSLRADSRVYAQGLRNVNDGVSLLNIADGALTELSNIVIRIKEISEQAANGTLSSQQRKPLDKEAQELAAEYKRITQSTTFNNVKLLNGSQPNLRIQGGYGESASLAATVGGAVGTGTFALSQTLTLSSYVGYAIAVGDLNGDGQTDIATAGLFTGALDGWATVSLAGAGGTFATPQTYAVENGQSNAISLTDLNLDGVLDLVTAGNTDGLDGYATIRLGIGNGTFGSAISYASESRTSYSVATNDINNDGIPDLITGGRTDSLDGGVTVRIGVGNGTFGAAVSYTSELGGTNGIKLGDLNSDGILDLVSGGYNDTPNGFVSVRLGAGNGTFGSLISYASEGMTTVSISLNDLNGDGKLDIISAGGDGTNGYATVRLGTGSGSFLAANSFLINTEYVQDLKIIDVNGDGIFDLVGVGQGNGGLAEAHISLGNGDGTFRAATSFATHASYAMGSAFADLNDDGASEWITTGGSTIGFVRINAPDTVAGVSDLGEFSLASIAQARESLTNMSKRVNILATQRGVIGAYLSRFDSAASLLAVVRENYISAESQIRDADVAQEAANLAKGRILQQAAASVLAQANLEPQIALRLLQRS